MNQKKACPSCGDIGTFELVQRKWWIWPLPKGRFYRCFICDYCIFEWAETNKPDQQVKQSK